MTIKYFFSMFLLLSAISFSSFCQKKRKQIKEIKTDTILVFNQLELERFSEKNVYWSDKNEVGIIYSQWYRSLDWDGGSAISLTVVFYSWDSIQLNKVYDLQNLLAECESKAVFGGDNFDTPTGEIIFNAKTDNRLTFQFDAQALSKDKRKLLIFRGVRGFVPDY